jgi:hypothetical protein
MEGLGEITKTIISVGATDENRTKYRSLRQTSEGVDPATANIFAT